MKIKYGRFLIGLLFAPALIPIGIITVLGFFVCLAGCNLCVLIGASYFHVNELMEKYFEEDKLTFGQIEKYWQKQEQ